MQAVSLHGRTCFGGNPTDIHLGPGHRYRPAARSIRACHRGPDRQACLDVSLPAEPLTAPPPIVPVGVPSELLERRPDIAAAERQAAMANAQIGAAEAAYYPTVTLSATGGFQSSDLGKWLTWPSHFWALGGLVSETLFDGGLRGAQKDQARAVYDEAVASYRQTVLTGFQEVEDNLAALRILEEEAAVQDAAVAAAQQSVVVYHQPVQGGDGQLPQHHRQPGGGVVQRESRCRYPRPPDDRQRTPYQSFGGRLEGDCVSCCPWRREVRHRAHCLPPVHDYKTV